MDPNDIKTAAGAACVVITVYGFAGVPILKAAIGEGHPAYNAIVVLLLGLLSLGVSALGAVEGLNFITANFVTIFIGCWVASVISAAAAAGGAQQVGHAVRGLRGL